MPIPNFQKRFILVLVIFATFLLLPTHVVADVQVTDSFAKTLTKISKTKVREDIIAWLKTEDPIAGIIARNLIVKVIEGQSEEEIVKSSIESATELAFLNNISGMVTKNIETNKDIISQAKAVGWSEDELVAYASLYLYFSQCLKYKIYVPNFIFTEYKQERTILENFKTPQNKKWITKLFKETIAADKHKNNNSLSDVRSLELFKINILQKLGYKRSAENIGELEKQIKNHYFSTANITTSSVTAQIQNMFLNQYTKNNLKLTDEENALTSFSQQLMLPLAAFLQHTSTPEETKLNLIQATKTTLADLLKNSASNNLLSYHILLSGSLNQTTKLQPGKTISYAIFSIQDQLRIYLWEHNLFVYSGGVIDPILRGIILKSDHEVQWPFGIGVDYQNWSICVGVGVGINNLSQPLGIVGTIGYKIPISDIVW